MKWKVGQRFDFDSKDLLAEFLAPHGQALLPGESVGGESKCCEFRQAFRRLVLSCFTHGLRPQTRLSTSRSKNGDEL